MAQGFAFVAQGDNKNAQGAFERIAEAREGHGDGLVVSRLFLSFLPRVESRSS